MASSTDFTHKSSAFRQHLPNLSQPRFTIAAKQNPYEYAAAFEKNAVPPQLHALVQEWRHSYAEPLKGITTDGTVRPDLYHHQDEGIDMTSIVHATETMLDACTPSQRSKLQHPLNTKARRRWTNPEFYLHQHGLRLEELTPDLRARIHDILRATLSQEGYQKAIAAMRVNSFLGSLVGLPQLMNEDSYNFCLFGCPSETQPWAWSLYGHHLCLCVFMYGGQVVVAPAFTGAEPNVIDTGPFQGMRILIEEERAGGELIASLERMQGENAARVYEGMQPPEVPEERWNRDEQRHLCGAGRDNRVVPYEGVCVGRDFNDEQKDLVRRILEQFLLYLPKRARELKLRQCEEYFAETWFCWIGAGVDVGMGEDEDEPFYYRVQSPVVVVEFDHHSGVFLTNERPERFHTHTILRYPNQGDYGLAMTPRELVQGL